jgi:hypothetical protein
MPWWWKFSGAGPKIFLSHKVRDGAAAAEIKSLILAAFPSLRNEVNQTDNIFLSSDANSIPKAATWQLEIEKQLRDADSLLLLYTDPQQTWDWCLYEGGYFAGNHFSNAAKLSYVIHPQGGAVPAPLRNRQSVPATRADVLSCLKRMLRTAAEAAYFGDAQWNELADRVAGTVQRLGSRYYAPQKLMRVRIPGTAGAAAAAATSSLPPQTDVWENATVTFDAKAAAVFGRDANVPIPWAGLKGELRSSRFDVAGLHDLVIAVRELRDPAAALGLFRGPKDRTGYRPVLVDRDVKEDGLLELQLMLVELPETFRIDDAQDFDVAAKLFYLASQFRWRVVEAHAARLEAAPPGDEQTHTLMRNLHRSIEDVLAEARNLRMDEENRERVLRPFSEDERRRMTQAGDAWGLAHKRLTDAVDKGDVVTARHVLTVMRLLNYEFLTIALARLTGVTRSVALPPTAGLPAELAALIPEPLRNSRSRLPRAAQRPGHTPGKEAGVSADATQPGDPRRSLRKPTPGSEGGLASRKRSPSSGRRAPKTPPVRPSVSRKGRRGG